MIGYNRPQMKSHSPEQAKQGRVQQNIDAHEQWSGIWDRFDDQDDERWQDDRVDPAAPEVNGKLSAMARSGDLQGIKALLDSCGGIDLDEHGPDLNTPLHSACWSGQFDCAKLLIERGASASALNRDGTRPIDNIIHIGDDPATVSALIRLLAAHGASIDEEGMFSPKPFHAACRCLNLAAARTLVELGADPWSKNAEGENAFDIVEARSQRRPRGPRRHHRVDYDAQRQNLLDWLDALWENEELRFELAESLTPASEGKEAEDPYTPPQPKTRSL